MLIRDATPDDLPAIVAIYNETILSTTGAWREHPDTVDDRQAWFAARLLRGHPAHAALHRPAWQPPVNRTVAFDLGGVVCRFEPQRRLDRLTAATGVAGPEIESAL